MSEDKEPHEEHYLKESLVLHLTLFGIYQNGPVPANKRGWGQHRESGPGLHLELEYVDPANSQVFQKFSYRNIHV